MPETTAAASSYEPRDVTVAAVAGCLLALLILVIISVAVVRAVLRPLSPQQVVRSTRLDFTALSAIRPPSPMLGARPVVELQNWRQQEEELLQRSDLDASGESRMPIAQAMQRLVEQGRKLQTVTHSGQPVAPNPAPPLRPTAGEAP